MFKIRALAIVVLSLVLSCLAVCSQTSAQANAAPSAQTEPAQRKTSEPYTGDLSIFDSPGREDRLQINRVMDILGVAPGKTVADIGAGSGWFTVTAARRLGPSGRVYAVDINPEAVRYSADRAHKEQLANVKTILTPLYAVIPRACNFSVMAVALHASRFRSTMRVPHPERSPKGGSSV